MAEQNRRNTRFVTTPDGSRTRPMNTLDKVRVGMGDQGMLRREYDAADRRARVLRQQGQAAAASQPSERTQAATNQSNTTQKPRNTPIRGLVNEDRARTEAATERGQRKAQAKLNKERTRNINDTGTKQGQAKADAEDLRRTNAGGTSGKRTAVNAGKDAADATARSLKDSINKGTNFVNARTDVFKTKADRNAASGNVATSETPEAGTEQPRSLRQTARNAGGRALQFGKNVLGSRAALGTAAVTGLGTLAYNMWPDGDPRNDQPAQNQAMQVPATSGPDPEAPRTGADGTPLPTGMEASNPNAQVTEAGYAVPTGEGDMLPFGRTPEVQQQIDQNVAGINRTTNALRENNNLRRELAGGRQLGTRQEGTPEQRQIRDLVSKMRSGSIGDKNRNNVIAQQIAALQGVDTTNVAREGVQADRQAAMLEQQQAYADRVMEAQGIERDEARYINEALADPEQAPIIEQYLAGLQAGGPMSPSQRSTLLESIRQQGSRRLPSLGALRDNTDRIDPTNPSLAGAERISGGGWFGDMLGFGPGYEMPNGAKIRDDDLRGSTQRILDEAIRRDNPGR